MNHYLIIYHKPTGALLSCTGYLFSRDALSERFKMERLFERVPEMEIVVLGAKDLDQLRKTHGKYFINMQFPLVKEKER